MKTRYLPRLLAITIIMMFTLGSIFTGQAAAKTYTFKIDTFWGPEFHATKNSVLPCLDVIEKESDGRIQFNIFYAQSLAQAREGYDAAAMGLLDIYFFTGPNYETGNMLRGAIFSLPFSLPMGKDNVKAACRIMETVYNDQVIQEIDSNIVVLGWGVLSEYRFMTVEKVETLEDIRGMTLRSSGGYHDDIIKSVGASPESMSPGDIYEALEKGILDGVFHTYAAEYGWGTYEPMNYATDMGIATFPYYTVMNKRKFDRLPNDLKTLLQENFKSSAPETGFSYYNDENEHFKDMGIEQVTLSIDVKNEMLEATMPVWKKWIEKCEERNIDWKAIIKSLEAAWTANNLEPKGWINLTK
ncbi:MAG: TRAP transporter substrate-binding protein DctP [Desulfotignum sp.]|jgi:TRAP-type C4-dicarboxylate transport system substrate-binding protein|nr:TRAP transporter substrate-binding protein DctP [Desulfotignum sp.]